MKKGRENNQFLPRKFVLSELENTIKYFVKDRKDPKAIIKISDINVAFSPKKIPFPNSLQLDYLKDGSTRHIFVYHDDPQTVVNWYHAIRCCKLHLLQIGYPSVCNFHYNKIDFVVRKALCARSRNTWKWTQIFSLKIINKSNVSRTDQPPLTSVSRTAQLPLKTKNKLIRIFKEEILNNNLIYMSFCSF